MLGAEKEAAERSEPLLRTVSGLGKEMSRSPESLKRVLCVECRSWVTLAQCRELAALSLDQRPKISWSVVLHLS